MNAANAVLALADASGPLVYMTGQGLVVMLVVSAVIAIVAEAFARAAGFRPRSERQQPRAGAPGSRGNPHRIYVDEQGRQIQVDQHGNRIGTVDKP